MSYQVILQFCNDSEVLEQFEIDYDKQEEAVELFNKMVIEMPDTAEF